MKRPRDPAYQVFKAWIKLRTEQPRVLNYMQTISNQLDIPVGRVSYYIEACIAYEKSNPYGSDY